MWHAQFWYENPKRNNYLKGVDVNTPPPNEHLQTYCKPNTKKDFRTTSVSSVIKEDVS
jgi:hypothetical protein